MTPLQASPMTLSTSTPFNKTHPSPIYIDAIQLGLQLYVASLASKVRRREFPLDRYPLTKFFPTGRIKISRSGFISIGSNYNNGDRCYLSTNGAKIFRGVTGAGEPHARTKKAAKTVDNQL
ncbi:MAG: hypothetical protein NTV34_15425, partial [Proteobacteria bacterium]|nr:hypothetical protein [Pseudomonadota bacterium]